jgi:hypothetical protein
LQGPAWGLAAAGKPATYVGSLKCKECHDKIYATWRQTIHAKAIQEVSENPQAIQGDWTQLFELRTFKKEDVKFTHGVQWKQRYIDKDWHILPAQWNFDDQKWTPTPDAQRWKQTNWITECAQCHVTGFDRENAPGRRSPSVARLATVPAAAMWRPNPRRVSAPS